MIDETYDHQRTTTNAIAQAFPQCAPPWIWPGKRRPNLSLRMTLRPEFVGRWLSLDNGNIYVVTVDGSHASFGLRFIGSTAVGWFTSPDAKQAHDLDDLVDMKLDPGRPVHLKITRHLRDTDTLQFFAKDSAGWWHLYSQPVHPEERYSKARPIRHVGPKDE